MPCSKSTFLKSLYVYTFSHFAIIIIKSQIKLFYTFLDNERPNYNSIFSSTINYLQKSDTTFSSKNRITNINQEGINNLVNKYKPDS